MSVRFINLGLMAAASAALLCGHGPMAPAQEAPQAGAAAEAILQFHWLGKEQLAKETTAAGFVSVWNLPESGKLEAQTLDKCARALASGLGSTLSTEASGPARGAWSGLVRPMLDDLVRRESYLELRQAGGQADLALAIRLDAPRAALWDTNFAALLETLPDAAALASPGKGRCWQLRVASQPASGRACLRLARAGPWTVLGVAPGQGPRRSSLDRFLQRIQNDQAPLSIPAANGWLEAELDLPRLAGLLAPGWNLPDGMPKLSLKVTGDGATAIIRAELNFPKPLRLALDPWNLPTNLVCGKLISFSAIRGIEPCLASLPAWQDLKLGPPPDQFYSWALAGVAMQAYVAAPSPDASNQVSRLADLTLEKAGPWLAVNAAGKLRKSVKTGGLEWPELGFLSPFLRAVATNGQAFIFGGLFPSSPVSAPLPPALVQKLDQTSLVAYNWELTALRVDQWFNIGQSLRLVMHREQLPARSAALTWLKTVAPGLWPSVTEVTQTGPSTLLFKRRSTLGLASLELHLLADWLESPRFPRGLYTLLGPPFVPGETSPPPPPGPAQAR